MPPLRSSIEVAASAKSKSTQLRNPRQPQRPASFYGRPTAAAEEQRKMLRPKTQPDLRSMKMLEGNNEGAGGELGKRVPAKVLVNVTVQRSLGPVQVIAPTTWIVRDLIITAAKQYVKEGMRPPLPTTDPSVFTLHYSQFSLEGLDPQEKLIGLSSRNFFLCYNSVNDQAKTTPSRSASPSPSASCSREAGKEPRIASSWLRFFDFLLMLI